jgi:hypothetical protein
MIVIVVLVIMMVMWVVMRLHSARISLISKRAMVGCVVDGHGANSGST